MLTETRIAKHMPSSTRQKIVHAGGKLGHFHGDFDLL
jgi:hypothetical protein